MQYKQRTNVWSGATAGFLATLPMTIFMLSTQRFLPKGERYDLPPEMIIKELAHRAHVRLHMNKALVLVATTISHFGYGATMGVIYSLFGSRLPLTSSLKGILFGFFIWAASYQVLLPLLGFSVSSHKETTRRNLMMVVAHFIWGACTGIVTEVLS